MIGSPRRPRPIAQSMVLMPSTSRDVPRPAARSICTGIGSRKNLASELPFEHKDTILRYRVGSAHRVPAIHGGGAESRIDAAFADLTSETGNLLSMPPLCGEPTTKPGMTRPSRIKCIVRVHAPDVIDASSSSRNKVPHLGRDDRWWRSSRSSKYSDAWRRIRARCPSVPSRYLGFHVMGDHPVGPLRPTLRAPWTADRRGRTGRSPCPRC